MHYISIQVIKSREVNNYISLAVKSGWLCFEGKVLLL
jgi:hypothetical protein